VRHQRWRGRLSSFPTLYPNPLPWGDGRESRGRPRCRGHELLRRFLRRRTLLPHFSAQSAVSTRCGLTGGVTHDRLRTSFTPARTPLPHQAVASATIRLCPPPHLP